MKTEKEIESKIYQAIKKSNMSNKEGFKLLYKVLFNKDHGPKLAPFLLKNKERVIERIKQVLGGVYYEEEKENRS